ncbi:hypothetical protein SPACI_027170 [Sporomusa acidovorans DSM 3132]|uniref:Uncharacterized protein n=1 Tax=Sporomusa acidovorans (strain ATCC 49682 / DSM 3132 / Mol) TaxID=1123286 RepID=A0ABZ3J2Q6_SPOA4|nr:hypothetical protein SPACI_25590 [Sporomusa acidovorans DSM 3132]SDD43412.1 hypothetical protein SAMN04488499_1001229 [Sporomusa acidovorans]
MAAKNKLKKKVQPVVNISLLNYTPVLQDNYSQKFMLPLFQEILKQKNSVNRN